MRIKHFVTQFTCFGQNLHECSAAWGELQHSVVFNIVIIGSARPLCVCSVRGRRRSSSRFSLWTLRRRQPSLTVSSRYVQILIKSRSPGDIHRLTDPHNEELLSSGDSSKRGFVPKYDLAKNFPQCLACRHREWSYYTFYWGFKWVWKWATCYSAGSLWRTSGCPLLPPRDGSSTPHFHLSTSTSVTSPSFSLSCLSPVILHFPVR